MSNRTTCPTQIAPPLPADDDDSFLQQDFKEGNTRGEGSMLKWIMRWNGNSWTSSQAFYRKRCVLAADATQRESRRRRYLPVRRAHEECAPIVPQGRGRGRGRRRPAEGHGESGGDDKAKKKPKKPKKLEVRSGNTPTKTPLI